MKAAMLVDSLWVLGTRFLLRGANFLIFLLLARALTVGEFGFYGYLMSTAVVLSVLGQFVKHALGWSRDATHWIEWLSGARIDPTLTVEGFVRWIFPHPGLGAAVAVIGTALVLASAVTESGEPSQPAGS